MVSSSKSSKQKNASSQELHIGITSSKQPLFYDLSHLKKHFIALGASGSGKTVLSKVLIEEATMQGIPSILVDVQGDLSALALRGNKEEIIDKGLDEQAFNFYNKNVATTIFTPVSSKGIPLCINPLQLDDANIPAQERISVLHSIANAFVKLLGYLTTNDKGKFAEAIIYTVLDYSVKEKEPLQSFDNLIALIQNPPEKIKQEISSFEASQQEITSLIRKIKFMGVGEKQLLFQFGVPVDIELLLGKQRKDSKTQQSIIYLNTLHEQEEKEFFIAALTSKLYQWMLNHPSKELQCLYMIDEIAPFIPAGAKKPMPKEILQLLFKQARKYGVGCLIATQNPGDIDYKAFAQFGSWALGRLTLQQDIKKVQQALHSSTKQNEMQQLLPQLSPGEFILFAPDHSKDLIHFTARWLYTQHKTLDEEEIASLMKEQQKFYKKFHVQTTKSSSKKTSSLQPSQDQSRSPSSPASKSTNSTPTKSNSQQKSSHREYLCFPCVSQKTIKKLAKKEKKTPLFSRNEKLVSLKEKHIPYFQAKVQTIKNSLFSKPSPKTHTVFFHAQSGHVLNIRSHKHKVLSFTQHLLDLTENQLRLAKTLLAKKKEHSVTELAQAINVDTTTVTRNIAPLVDRAMVSHRKEGTYKYYRARYRLPTRLSYYTSGNPKLKTKKLDVVDAPDFSTQHVKTFVEQWFKGASVIDIQLVYATFYQAIYQRKGKQRTVYINATTKQISSEPYE